MSKQLKQLKQLNYGATAKSLHWLIVALLAAGIYKTVEEAQAAVCLPLRTVEPDPKSAAVYEQLYPLYRDVYFALGSRDAAPIALGKVLPELRKVAAQVQKAC